ncbi:MAG: TIM barrel protein [Acidobacteria bacterium]|nr:TIM barrel protein [Acidobacteriota bacterium]
MRWALSTRLFADQRLTAALLDKVARAGVGAVQLDCDRRHLDYRQRGQIDDLRHWFADSELQPVALVAPQRDDQAGPRGGPDGVIRITERDKPARIKATDELKRALELADLIPFRLFILHFGVVDEEFHEAKIDSAFNALDELHVMARQLGVEILLENFPNELCTADQLARFLRLTHLPFGYAFRVGAAHRGAGVEEEFEKMRDGIRVVELEDNDGEADLRLFPEDEGGTVDWPQVMRLIRGLDSSPLLALDPGEGLDEAAPLDKARRVFDRLESLRD